MVQEITTSNKRVSKDINRMLPPHLRAKGIKQSKFSSPLKNQVEIKEDKASIFESNIQNENLNPNVNAVNEMMISRSKSTNEAIDQKQRNNFYNNEIVYDIKKSNSYSNGNIKVQPVKSNYTSISRSDSLNYVNNLNVKDALIINTKRNELFNSQAPLSATNTGAVTSKAAKRRSSSLPTSPLDMFNTNRIKMGNFDIVENKTSIPQESFLERPIAVTRSTSRSGSDNKIQQILGEGAIDSFERNNSQQLNECITNKDNKGNREKIHQILIDGNNKNKISNKEVASISSNASSSSNGNINKIDNSSMKKSMTLNELTAVSSKEKVPTINNSNNDYPSSILLNGNHSTVNEIERNGSTKSVSIIDKNGTIRSLNNGGESQQITRTNDNNLNGIASPVRSNSGKLNESQLSFVLPLSQSSNHMKVNSNSLNSSSDEEHSVKVNNMSSGPISNIITPSAATIQQESILRSFNNDEIKSPRNDIFSYGRKMKEEKNRRREENNSIKISRETLVFSCFIEKLSSRRKFQKRILRFDGIFLTCLSPKKKKLPPHTQFTMVNLPFFSESSSEGKMYLDLIKKLYSNTSPGPEFSAPLIAVEDSKSKNGSSNPNLKSKHLYVPKWIVNIKDIILIFPLIHPDLLSFSDSSNIYKNLEPELERYTTGDIEKDKKTFIFVTRDNTTHVIRTYTEKEFNRWLYILTRSKEILEELVDPRLMVTEVLPPPPSSSPDPTKVLSVHGNMNRNSAINFDPDPTKVLSVHGNMNRNSAINFDNFNKNFNNNNNIKVINISNVESTDSSTDASNENIRRFMSGDDDELSPDYSKGHHRNQSRTSHHSGSIGHHSGSVSHHSGSIGRSGSALSNTNVDLMSLYTNKTGTIQLKNKYTDLIDSKLPKDPLYLHYTICDYWKGVLEQLYDIDKDIYSSVTRVENSELMKILREDEEDKNEKDEDIHSSVASEDSELMNVLREDGKNKNRKEQIVDDQKMSRYNFNEKQYQLKDKAVINAMSSEFSSENELMSPPMAGLKPRPRSSSAPPIADIKSKYQLEDDGIKSAGVEGSSNIFNSTESNEQSRRKHFVSIDSNTNKNDNTVTNISSNTSQPLNSKEDNLIHSHVYTVDTIEQPQLMTMKKTSDNRPMKQHRSSIYRPNTTESIRIPSSDPTLKQPFIQSIPWDGDLIFAIMGLLRIFHRLSGIPFVEDGENENNTPPPPIPRWYYQFCVKSIPVYVIQIQNMMIDYLQELEYQQSKQDEIEVIKDEIRQRNKTLLSERYGIVQSALDSFIKLSSLWEDIMNQWKLEMMREKFNADIIPINENEIDTFLLQHVQVSDVLNVHTKIKDYLGKEILIGCRNLLKLFEKEE